MADNDKWILGRKVGMTQIFDEGGQALAVTVIKAGPCTVVRRRTMAKDGYTAVQVGFETVSANRLTKPMQGQFARAKVKPARILREYRCDEPEAYEPGQEINCDVFAPGDAVDVTAKSKGRGFAGVIKRYGFSRGPMTHGSKYHRRVGSMQSRAASRVFKGRKLPGRMGGGQVTAQNLTVVSADPERYVLVLKGAVPGPNGGLVSVRARRKGRR